MQIRHFRHFRQNPLFLAGDKTTVSQNHRFDSAEGMQRFVLAMRGNLGRHDLLS